MHVVLVDVRSTQVGILNDRVHYGCTDTGYVHDAALFIAGARAAVETCELSAEREDREMVGMEDDGIRLLGQTYHNSPEIRAAGAHNGAMHIEGLLPHRDLCIAQKIGLAQLVEHI